MEINIRILQDIGCIISTVFDKELLTRNACYLRRDIGIGVLSCGLHLNEPHLILFIEKIAGLAVDPAGIAYAHASRLK